MNENNQLIKPITLEREELIDGFAKLINGSSLPFFVVEDILKNFLNEVHIASQHQIEVDKQKYYKSISKMQMQLSKDISLEGDTNESK
ncbi:MAG: hypothetical protein J6R59_09710 [Paludibacteraceae bacterium]|nr:hypothetical protein [Paludibacteraceae bacterium]